MTRNLLIPLAIVLLFASLGALVFALNSAPLRLVGLIATGMLLFAFAVLSGVLVRQRGRLHQVQNALQRAELRSQGLVDTSPDGVVLLSGSRVLFANPAFRSLFAIPVDEELVGRDMLSLVSATDRPRVEEWIREGQARGGAREGIQFTGLCVNGDEVSLDAAGALLPAVSGRQFAVFLRDMSGRLSLERRLRHLERLEAMADLGENLVSDFDRLFLDIRKRARAITQDEDKQPDRETLEAIERLASRGAALSRRVRSVAPSAVDRRAHRPMNLVKLVQEVSADYLRAAPEAVGLQVAAESGPLAYIRGDASQIRQALWQILRNAREAQKDDNPNFPISVLTQVTDLDEKAAQMLGVDSGSYVVVSISDHGPGMDEETRKRAFQPFFSTRGSRRAGLGLTLTYATLRSHRGFVEVDSHPGSGTTVRLGFPTIPAQEIPHQPIMEPVDPGARWRGRETVLVVDDDHATREECLAALEEFGYHVELTNNPRNALQRLRQRPQVDLVLLDMVLPGWNGPDVLRKILKHWPGLRVLMISPYPLQEHEDQAMQIGAAGIVRRPFTSEDLARNVREAMDRPPPTSG